MGFLSNLLKPNSNKTSASNAQNTSSKVQSLTRDFLYMSIQNNFLNLLVIDESSSVGNIKFKEDIYLGPYENLSVGENVKDLFSVLDKILKERKGLFDGKAGIYVALPAIDSFFKNIEVPKGEADFMRRLVLAEMKKILPVDFSQVLYAENNLGEMSSGKNSFFSVCVQKDLLAKFEKVFKDNGAQPNFEIEIFSLARIAKRDDAFRSIVFVNNFYTLIATMKGQIIHDVKVLEQGTFTLSNKISKETGMALGDVYKLLENYTKIYEENRPSASILTKYMDAYSKDLAKIISVAIFPFEKKYGVFNKEIILAGSGSSHLLVKYLVPEFDKDTTVSIIGEDNLLRYNAENFKRDDLKRYAQCFGLALKRK